MHRCLTTRVPPRFHRPDASPRPGFSRSRRFWWVANPPWIVIRRRIFKPRSGPRWMNNSVILIRRRPLRKPDRSQDNLETELDSRLDELEKLGPQSSDGGASLAMGAGLDGEPLVVVPISLEAAIRTAVEHNLGIQRSRVDQAILRRRGRSGRSRLRRRPRRGRRLRPHRRARQKD